MLLTDSSLIDVLSDQGESIFDIKTSQGIENMLKQYKQKESIRQALSPIEESKEPHIIIEEAYEEEKNPQFTSPRRDSLENKQITSRITAKLQKFTNFIRRSSQASVNSSELFPPENEQLRRSVILVG